jgi:type 1 glutamine amidotransferase
MAAKRVISLFLTLLCATVFWPLCVNSESLPTAKKKGRKIVLLAGPKSHGPNSHEYIKAVRLIKVMLDNSNVKGITTEIHLNGWPENPSTLDDADLILTTSDGRDGPIFSDAPFLLPERMAVMEKQMKRGCGFSVIHFSTFATREQGVSVLEWGGGFFDWQDDAGNRNWYSAIKTINTTVQLPTPGHPIARGVKPFQLNEEFYYNIRFRPNDARLKPIAEVPALEGRAGENGNVVAWAVQRKDGGRGFSTTMGHFFENWKNPDFRKLLLNGIVWAAGAEVPKTGVNAPFYTDREVTLKLTGASKKVLILTGNHHPAHPWKETTPLLKTTLERQNYAVDVSTTIEDLSQYNLQDYDVLLMNYCNWENPTPLSDAAKASFTGYLNNGGGLIILHFANGAFHFSLPKAEGTDWPEYRKITRRVWDHHSNSGHDPYGKFAVKIAVKDHPITKNLNDFETTDELYFNQKGDEPITPLLTARSKVTNKDEPLAWVYRYGKGKIFQTVLGHDAKALETPTVQEIIQRAADFVIQKD